MCDERSQTASGLVSRDSPAVHVVWRLDDPLAADHIARAIAGTDSRVVVVQHHPGMINWDMLTALLVDRRVACRELLITLHSVLDLQEWPDRERVLKALHRASRILVHNVRDLIWLRSSHEFDNVTLFPHGAMRLPIARPLARELPGQAGPVIGTYGFMRPNKGIDVLIEAFALICHEWPGARLRMVTAEYPHEDSPAEIGRCQALARSLGVENSIEWHTDYLSDEDSLALLHGCDLLVLPRKRDGESASGSARVAMASQVPVLVTPIEIFEEMGQAVIRADGTHMEAIAAGIVGALHNQKMRQQTVDNSDRWLAEHDWGRMSERLYGLICALGGPRTPSHIESFQDVVGFHDLRKSMSIDMQKQNDDAIANFVRDLYCVILGREADTEGLDTYKTALKSGFTIIDILRTFLSSPEYVSRMQRNVLLSFSERSPDIRTLLEEGSVAPLNYVPAGEGTKSYLRRSTSGFFDKYCAGCVVLDIGFKGYENPDNKTFIPNAIGIDVDFPGYDGINLPFADGSVDAIFSSHCLEHIAFDQAAIREWHRVLKIGGFIVCIVPSQALYEKRRFLPSLFSADHKRMYTASSLANVFEACLEPNSYKVRHLMENDSGYTYDIGPDRHAGGCYEIEIVVEKMKPPAWRLA